MPHNCAQLTGNIGVGQAIVVSAPTQGVKLTELAGVVE